MSLLERNYWLRTSNRILNKNEVLSAMAEGLFCFSSPLVLLQRGFILQNHQNRIPLRIPKYRYDVSWIRVHFGLTSVV